MSRSEYEGFEPRVKETVYLKLKEKGDKIKFRIAGPVYREPKVWPAEQGNPPMVDEEVAVLDTDDWMQLYRDPEYNIAEVFHWPVIDRDSGKAKIFTGTGGTFNKIKELALMDDWGDPETFDIQIERTEDPGKAYYSVQPLPNREELSDRQKELIGELDFAKLLPAARKISERQVDFLPDLDDSDERDEGGGSMPAPKESRSKKHILKS
jgi:hypothetical protein